MENTKSVREIAEEIGVSRQAVRDEIKRQRAKLPAKDFAKHFAENSDGFALDEDAENLVKTSFLERKEKRACKEPAKHFAGNFVGNFAEIGEVLQKEIEVKNAQIDAQAKVIETLTETIRIQTEQITALTDSLRAAQALHAGTLQERLTQNETQPAEDPKEEREPEEEREQAEPPAKKWWQFWK